MIRIRQAGVEDAELLALVAGASFLETYFEILHGPDILHHCHDHHGPDAYRRFLGTGSVAWLVEHEKTAAPLGYALVTRPDLPVRTEPDDLELRRIYLLSRCHGTGAGQGLLAAASDHARGAGARRLLLGVYKGNARALSFYEKMGFVPVGERQFRVGARVYDDHVLALTLAGQ